MLVKEFKASVYVCPNCGHIELYHPEIGLEVRQRKDESRAEVAPETSR